MRELKEKVLEGNLKLVECGLVILTWGNVSAYDREKGLVAIKPSGVPYAEMTADDIVVLDLDGKIVEGDLRPSTDTATHLEIYKAFPQIGSVIHTHSKWATIWAQMRMDMPCFGTTHADFFFGSVPCTREITDDEIDENYEKITGQIIVETIKKRGKDPISVPGILAYGHAPFTWGKDVDSAVKNSVVLERIAEMNYYTLFNSKAPAPLKQSIIEKHYNRKFGPNAYYGQEKHN
ncbi:MAG TPA: L-ribulose-5-phosphate 4-epimerase [Firmicutes bacterium]|nr:L-ribulose-5-phosphate 4-epimerase [Bacillota bacterium]